MMRIFFPDRLHFHERNFGSLIKFIKNNHIEAIYNDERKDWLTLFGDYDIKRDHLAALYEHVSQLSSNELFGYCRAGTNIFQLARAEVLCAVIPKPEWGSLDIPGNNDQDLFRLLYAKEHDLLCLNIAAALDWLDFWEKKLDDTPTFNHCCVFSGSLIYARTLMSILRYRHTKVFVLESFFTGNDYYFEERTTPIANNSRLAIPNYFNNIKLEEDSNLYDRERVKALNKIALGKNKNVSQPAEASEDLGLVKGKPTLLILGQVGNDFSIIETKTDNLNITNIYWSIIQKIYEKSDHNIIFKGHPWELVKYPENSTSTIKKLQNLVENKYGEASSRIKFVEDHNLYSLFRHSDHVAGFCSQGLIEAAHCGFKATQFGNAFFGHKGFTHDYKSKKAFVDDYLAGKLSNTLTLSEYDSYETFLLKALVQHLVSVNKSGIRKLNSLFNYPDTVPLASAERPITQRTDEGIVKRPPPLVRKWRKFRQDPHRFFLDVKFRPFRIFRFIFSKKSS